MFCESMASSCGVVEIVRRSKFIMSENQIFTGGRSEGRGSAPPGEQNASTVPGRGRGHGRGCGRGRGRGVDQAAVLEDPLVQIRSERTTTQRRVAALPAAVRQELIVRKRQAHLERMLLPDAPPRKRQTRKISPERQPCVMAAPRVLNVASTSAEPLSSELDAHRPVSDTTTSVEADFEFVGDWSGRTIIINADIEVAAEVVVGTSSSSNVGPSQIGVTDDRYDGVMGEWLQLTETFDSDDDDVNDGLEQDRTVQEPACEADLTTFQSEVLRREDVANDLAIRAILPDDCYTFNWSKDRLTFCGRRETFTGKSGPTFELTDQTRPIEVYDNIFDNDFLDLICTETNRYADHKIALLREQNKLGPHSRFNRWTPTDRDEIGSF